MPAEQTFMRDIFRERLKKIRKQNNTKQTELADYVGTTRQTISAYEHGVATPDIETLSKMAEYFDVTCDYFLGREEGTNHNVNYIMNETGLSEEAIKTLKKIVNSDNKNKYNILFAVNQLLGSKDSSNFLMSFTRYIAVPDIDKRDLSDKHFFNLYWGYNILKPSNQENEDDIMKIEDVIYSQLTRDFNKLLLNLKQNEKTTEEYISDFEKMEFEYSEHEPIIINTKQVKEFLKLLEII